MSHPLRSLAITPDGNRRYAERNRLGLEAAYAKGFEKVKEVGDWALETGVRSLTVWGLSYDNFRKRSSGELGLMFKLMQGRIREALEQRDLEQMGVRVRFVGRLEQLPGPLAKGMRELEERTQENRELSLNVAIAYGGREELLRAARGIAGEVARGALREEQIDEERFSQHLYLPEPVDLIIRTGGMRRLSGFLPWQSDYAELYFTDKLWPEFSRQDYQEALAYYQSVERNFGR